LRAPKRGRGGYREYSPEAIEIVRFVKRAQALGFTLEEIQELLALQRPRAGRCATVQRATTTKIEEIDAKIRSLAAMRDALEQLAIACSENAEQLHCPLIEMLAEARKEAP
jgi:DNA-binding transcriptional MerR regulator